MAPMDNDGIHKFAHGHREVFVDMLRLVAPALEAEFDFARAEPLPAAYVRPARGRHKQRFGDIAWRVPARGRGPGGRGGVPEHGEGWDYVLQSLE